MLFVFVAGGDAQIVFAGRQIDFVVGARLFVLVRDQLFGGQIVVGGLGLLGRGHGTSNGIGCFDFSTGSGSQALPHSMQVIGSSLPRS